ncbi:MAG: serine/threonine-protein kinase [Nitrososphaerota archaeon]
MPGDSDTLIGREIADYRLTGIVGNGGTSIVYRAKRKDDADTESAIKVLREPPGLTGSYATFRSRFYREAETAAYLRHEHILPVLDYGEWQGLPYLIMPLATGGTLGRHAGSEPGSLALDSIATYGIQLASALDYAHQNGIVHRDVKPSNALLDERGRLFLADFGIARLYNQSIHGTEETTLTSTGEVLGTPFYMAPEQLQGQRVGPAADIYALGVVLHLLATGRLPFEGETPLAVAMAHLHDMPLSPRLHRPDLPVPAAAAILSALAKDPMARFESAGTLAQAFAAGIEGRWTAENHERAITLDREVTRFYLTSPNLERPRTDTRRPASPLRTGLVVLAALVLLAITIATSQAIRNGNALSPAAATHGSVVKASASERLPATRVSGSTQSIILRYSGSQLYALWPDGSRHWTVWLDAPVARPPVIKGDLIYVTTVNGVKYTLRASDGAILSRVSPTRSVQSDSSGSNTSGTHAKPSKSGHGGDHHGKGDGGGKGKKDKGDK